MTDRAQGRTAAIAVPDSTRAVDVPAALAALRRWLPRFEKVTVVVGLGLHRPLTDLELEPLRKASPWTVVNHDPDDTVQLGVVDGVPCTVHPAFCDVDLVATVGRVELHQYAGLSGGHKGVSVGCGGRSTLAALHGRKRVCDPRVIVGRLDDNPFRALVDELGRRVGCQLALQTLPDGRWLAGHPDHILKQAVSALDPWQPVEHPVDTCVLRVPDAKAVNLYQASRAATYLALSPHPPLVEGARLILDARCPEGMGQGSGEKAFAALLATTPPPWDRLLTEPVPEGAGLQRAFMLARLARRYRLVIAGCETAAELRSLGLDATTEPADTIAGKDALEVPAPFSRLPQLRG